MLLTSANAQALGGTTLTRWDVLPDGLNIRLAPLVSIHSANIIGVQAVMTGHASLGFASGEAMLDAAHEQGHLLDLSLALWTAALDAFSALPHHDDIRLFLPLDSRALAGADRLCTILTHAPGTHALAQGTVVIQVSECHPIYDTPVALEGLDLLRKAAGRLAINNFGSGQSSLPLLYAAQPDFITLDHGFIANLESDSRKRLFVRQTVNLAHLLGIQVIVDGVQSGRGYLICKGIGCDVVAGPLVGNAQQFPILSPPLSQTIIDLNTRDRRSSGSDEKLVQAEIDTIAPIRVDADLQAVFERFRREQLATFFPVVNARAEPLGIVRERDLKTYAYSPFGKELLSNKGYGRQLADFLWKCPVADINTPAEKILEIFSADELSEGILIVKDGQYAGFLSTRSLLRILNEKNIAMARDQNPLTRLPGNAMINEYLGGAMADQASSSVIAYIDFDNFKPFNDKYGFRQGDRAITLFADILRKDLPHEGVFLGHIGGDDFFTAFRDLSFDEAESLVRHVIQRFKAEVESFYGEADRAAGFVIARDRQGVERQMPLLSASAALVHIPRGHAPGSVDEISSLIAKMKKEAKASPTRMAAVSLVATGD